MATLGNVVITENAPSALSTAGRIQATLPAGLTFAQLPSVSTGASYGLSVIQSGPNAPRLELGGQRFSFALGSRSHGSGGSLVLSGTLATVAPGVVGTVPVVVALGLDSSASNGLTATVPTVATLVPPPPDPVFTGIALSTDDAALGVTRSVILNGFNFGQLNFAGGDSIDFGAGITVIGTPLVNGDGTQITVQIQVNPAASLGSRTVAIVHGGTRITAPGNGGQFTVDPLPIVTSAGTTLDPNTGQAVGSVSASQTRQTIYIVGQNFVSPASPQDFVVQFGGTDITVDPNSLVYQSPTTVSVEALVANTAPLGPRTVTVRNPDFGTSAPVSALTVAAPQPDAPQGLGASKTQGTSTPPPAPTITNMSPAQAPTGATVTVFGSNFVSGFTVATFAGPNGSRITASPSGTVNPGSFPVVVPLTAVTGNVSVTANNVVSAGTFAFTVNNPRPSGLTPNSAIQGTTVTVDLTGVNFQNGMRVTVSGFAEVPTTFIDSTHVRFTLTVPPGATLGFRDVTARNTTDGGTGTLASAFQVNLASATAMTLVLKNLDGTLIDTPTWLPSVGAVQVTLDLTGRCTGKVVTPTSIIVEAHLAGTSVPGTLTYTITPSTIPGTAINEDCEIDPSTGLPTTTPTKDFSIGQVGSPPSLTAPLSVTVPVVAGVAQAQLASWDWGGKVLISVTDSAVSPTVAGTLAIPLDGDGDDLPDIYESNGVAGVDNTDANGVNVLDPTRGDQDANGILDRNDRFARDGLTNFEKYRGPYLRGPLNGTTGAMANHIRLGAGKRNLFVRSLGFSGDPAIVAQPGTCGIDNSGNPVAQAAAFLATFPCPYFDVGDAFRSIGVKVWDVAASFSATSVLPTKSYVTVTTPTLDMATVTLDAVNCAGGQPCDHAGKTGIRQWQFPTLGYSTFGSGTTFGDARVFLRGLRAYFTDRPYRHQENLAGTYLSAPPGAKPMLAPVTIVCDSAGGGSDNGLADLGECMVGSTLGGDVFVPGVFNSDMSAMDVNNDNCVELPFATDPTLLTPCTPNAPSATYPQATFQQVSRSIATHELGHATGINVHTADPTDLMYQYSTDWIRDGHFSPAAASLVQVHNKGLQ